jgi:putative drug exporter of the RND superfamily
VVQGGIGPQPAGRAAPVADRARPRGLERLGRFSARRRWAVLAVWLLIAIVLGVGAAGAGKPFRDVFTIPGSDSQDAVQVLAQRFPSENLPTAQLVFHDRSTPVSTATVAAVSAAVEKLPQVESTSPPRVSANGRTVLVTVTYSVPLTDVALTTIDRLDRATAPARAARLTVAYGGPVIDFVQQKTAPQNHADQIGFLAAIVILLFVFGTVVAALLPVTIALIGVVIATLVLTIIATVLTVGTVAPVLGTMIGLGVGIDYSLLIVSRFRQERDAGSGVHDAIGRSINTAGSASLFAGISVTIALCGLWFAGVPYVATLGFSAALFVTIMVLAALTLLPALLGILGPHIDRLRVLPRSKRQKPAGTGFWYRWGHEVARRAWWVLVASLVVLLLLAAPALSMRLGFTTDAEAPSGTTQREAYDLVTRGFGAGQNGPLLLTFSLPTGAAPAKTQAAVTAAEDLLAAIGRTKGIASVTPPLPNARRDAAVALATPTSAPNAVTTQTLVRTLRDDVIPAATKGTPLAGQVHVGGVTAELIDLTDRINARLVLCIGAVVLGAFLLLMMVFRSVLVPLKAAVMNLLSIGAAYGVIVAVFQWGWGKDLIGLRETIPIVAFVPLMMFAILFGLSMDYEVFLLSRIREEYLASGNNREAVAIGLAKTARVISSAALIMIAVFLSFVTSPDPTVKMIGLGLAVAVAVDATIVRLLLVPATMELLGNANWWLPEPLERLLPHINVEGTPTPPPAADPAPRPEPAPAQTARSWTSVGSAQQNHGSSSRGESSTVVSPSGANPTSTRNAS